MEKQITDSQQLHNKYPDIEHDLLKEWDSLGIDNDFIFYYVMQDESLLLELIQMILPDVPISRLEIQAQKTIDIAPNIHGVRFDIFATDEDEHAFTVEMQVVNKKNLPKRIRYYKSMSDTQMLDKGVDYNDLKESYVIMICPFDMFGLGLHLYTFTNRCKEKPSLELMDGTTSIILNAVGTANDVSENLKAFLDYVVGKMSEDSYVRRLDMAVELAKLDPDLKRDYLVRMQNSIQFEKEVRAKVQAEVQAEVRAEGQNELAKAIHMLKDGSSVENLLSAGIAQDTIDLARTCL